MRFVAVALVASGCSLLNAFDDVRPGSGGGGSGGTTSSATGGDGPGGQDASGGAGGEGAAGGQGGVGAGNLLFEDDFARADGDAVGNGWIEKTPAVFSLAGGKAVKAATMDNQRNSVVYRPETYGNVEVQATFVQGPGTPQEPRVLARGISATIDVVDEYYAYIAGIYPGTEDRFFIDRQLGTTQSPGYLDLEILAGTLVEGTTYRITLRTSGTGPIAVLGRLEELQGGTWTELSTVSFIDDDTTLSGDGTVGFTGTQATTSAFDDFRVTALP